MLDPVLYAFGVEKMLFMAVESRDKLLILEVRPANNALLLSMVEASAVLELVDGPEDEDLVVVVLEPVDIDEHVVLNDLFEDHDAIYNHKEPNHTQHQHHHVQEVLSELKLLLFRHHDR